jgi:hypothetical protein
MPRLKMQRPLRPERYYDDAVTVDSRDHVPPELGQKIFVVKRNGRNRWVILACPCGCSQRIEVNLMRSIYPHWRLRRHNGTISLWPSLWVSAESCGSHFVLIDNRVLWVGIGHPRR